ncbi:DUF885 domain-containing protein [Streptosporangiaceae bacterium NEAU-GS5]|nr:DUF885 domain-containing protein [Streptosporangiaceae bacterium NEAU-GS5]
MTNSPIFQLCDDYINRWAVLDPVAATAEGITGAYAPATDFSPDGHESRADLIRETLHALAGLDARDENDRRAADHLRERLEVTLALHDNGEPFREVAAPFGMINFLRDSVDLLPRSNDDEWRDVAARLAAIPGMLSGWRTSLTLGMQRRVVAARRQALELSDQAVRYGTAGTHAALIGAYGDGPVARDLAAGVAAAHEAYLETGRWLRGEYAPNATERDAAGEERYALGARYNLGDDVDLRDAYAWGWEELRRIEREMEAEADRIKPGATVSEAIALLEDTEFLTSSEAYLAWLRDRHDEALERLHGVHFDIAEPLRQVEVVLVPGEAGAPYYTPPSEDLLRPGRTWWPAGQRERYATWSELTTVAHEGVPGHHLQLGATKVAGDSLSRFGKVSWVSGHGEGWALYAERLADELGWFEERGTRLGMLCGSALRAARVVIDIGVHLGLPLPPEEAERHGPAWTFEVAKDVLYNRGRCEPHNVHPETVRYFGWPGQAISYKLGERAWLAARAEAAARPGFDLKQWHSQALALGPVGLSSLTAALRRITPNGHSA